MSLLAILMMLQTAPAGGEDGLLAGLAHTLDRIEVSIGQDEKGRWLCGLSQGSGHAQVDDNFCRAATACYQAHGNAREAVRACLTDSRKDILEDFRHRHARGQR